MTRIIAYLRVSTQKQGISGLGLEAQQAAIDAFARSSASQISGTFVEVESGKNNERPQLALALAHCKAMGAMLVVAKLDRLARDLVFVATLLRDGVEFIACDAPYANRLTLGILAAVAEDEGRRISERTKAALKAAKARGKVLGGYRGVPPSQEAGKKGRTQQSFNARTRALSLMPLITEIRATGVTATSAIASQLNARGVPAARGGAWQAVQVERLLRAASA